VKAEPAYYSVLGRVLMMMGSEGRRMMYWGTVVGLIQGPAGKGKGWRRRGWRVAKRAGKSGRGIGVGALEGVGVAGTKRAGGKQRVAGTKGVAVVVVLAVGMGAVVWIEEDLVMVLGKMVVDDPGLRCCELETGYYLKEPVKYNHLVGLNRCIEKQTFCGDLEYGLDTKKFSLEDNSSL